MNKLIFGIVLTFFLGFTTAKSLESYYVVDYTSSLKKNFLEKEYIDAKPAGPFTKCVYLKLFGVCSYFWDREEYLRLISQ